MNDLLIYLGDELLDVDDQTTVGSTLKIAEIGDLASRWTSYTNQFSLPFTSNNDRIYQHARDVRSNTRVPYTQQMIKVVQNGVEVISNGIHVLKKAYDRYEMQVYFRNAGFFSAIEGKKLWDLSGFKEIFNDPRTFRNTTSGLIYPVINPGIVLSGGDLVRIPFWYYSEVIERIMTDAGYTGVGAIFSDDKYQKMLINVSGSEAGYNPGFISERSVSVYVATNQIIAIGDGLLHDVNFTGITNAGTDPLGYWDGTSKYLTNDTDIPAGDIVFNANVRFNISFTGTGGQDIRVSVVSGSGTVLNVVDITSIGGIPKTATLDFAAEYPGAVIFPHQLNGVANGLKIVIQRINATTGNVTVVSGSLQIIPFAKPSMDSLVSVDNWAYYADLLPDMDQKDLIKDFMVRFGLLASEDNRVITFKDYNEIIADTTGKDFTDKRVDELPETSFNPLSYAMENIFDYSGSDQFTKALDMSGSISIDNENISPTKTIYRSPVNKSLTSVVNATYPILTAVVPVLTEDTIENNNWWNEDAGPRLLLVRDKYDFEPDYPGPGASTSVYKVAYFDDESQDYTMRFQQFVDDHYTLLTVILQNAKVVKRRYVMNEIDIVQFTFMKPIFDTDSFFLVSTVGPFVPGDPTEIEMLKISNFNGG